METVVVKINCVVYIIIAVLHIGVMLRTVGFGWFRCHCTWSCSGLISYRGLIDKLFDFGCLFRSFC